MSLFTNPPTSTQATFRKGDRHLGVYSIQTLLNAIYWNTDTDGVFGSETDMWVKKYQADVGIVSDGIVGQATQFRMARSCTVRAPHGLLLPKGLLEGQVALESGGFIAAVNSSVAGGIDYGFTQRRCYGPPFDAAAVQTAAEPLVQVGRSADDLFGYHEQYSVRRHSACPFGAWELAVLHHNWPYAADTYWKYGRLPDPNRVASWVTWTRMTWAEWAAFYVHSVTKDVVW